MYILMAGRPRRRVSPPPLPRRRPPAGRGPVKDHMCIHIYIYIYIYIYINKYISLSLYIYIYIYRERERENKGACKILCFLVST